MTKSTSAKRDRRRLLLWEACWIPVEMAGVGIGLLVGMGLDNWDVAGSLLFGVVCLSGLVRYWHYSKVVAGESAA
jgi:hypothetical protein